ncbi:hypothetical protein WJX84_011840 [Apatococcus fuscideae]|uniref:Uncharacterized protein n=1 Tax=Apatococcus fuscideae TaxID=2026836 RepID=A0AAW1T928_9CHLO
MQVTIKLQEQVMQEFGMNRRDMHAALQSFRSGPHEHPELKPLALYHRHQRSREEGLKDKAAMLAIYITEAHAMDEWPINSARCNGDRGPVNVLQPTSDEERCNLARTFCTNFDFKVPMVVDPVSNPFDQEFARWPLRFYILHKGKLANKAFPVRMEPTFAEPLPANCWFLKGEGNAHAVFQQGNPQGDLGGIVLRVRKLQGTVDAVAGQSLMEQRIWQHFVRRTGSNLDAAWTSFVQAALLPGCLLPEVTCPLPESVRRALLSILQQHGRKPCPHALADAAGSVQHGPTNFSNSFGFLRGRLSKLMQLITIL